MASTEGTVSVLTSKRDESTSTENAGQRPRDPIDSAELPFIVTHWLQNYNPDANRDERSFSAVPEDAVKKAALERIRKATSELASAFTALGAYGSFTVVRQNCKLLKFF
jgi:hypothetical protein